MIRILFLLLIFSVGVFAQQEGQPRPAAAGQLDLTEYGIRIEPDRRLIVMLASLEAADLRTPLSESGAIYREKLQEDLKDLPAETRAKIKRFVENYKRRHPKSSDAEVIAPFISMAYSLSPVPDLVEPTNVNDLPGDLLDVLDYTPLVREFYRRSGFAAKLDGYVKMYREAGDRMRDPARLMVRQLLDYLRARPQLIYIERIKTETGKGKKKKLQATEIREKERRFFVVPELLAPRGTVNFVNVGDDYSAIVAPNTDLAESEVRRAYLQFVIDPLILENSKDIFAKSEGIRQLLDGLRETNPNLSPDVFLAVSRSLVAAVDARQEEYTKGRNATIRARLLIEQIEQEQAADRAQKRAAGEKFDERKFDQTYDERKRAIVAELNRFKQELADKTALELSEAYEKGAVLAFYFADKLEGLEDSGFDIASALNDMIVSLDPAGEKDRLAEFAEARSRALKKRTTAGREVTEVREITVEDSLSGKLAAVEEIIRQSEYARAEAVLRRLLKDNPDEEPRIYYALGSLNSKAAAAAADEKTRDEFLKKAAGEFNNVLTSARRIEEKAAAAAEKSGSRVSFTALKSQTYFALGRIYEFFGEGMALDIYEAAIRLGDVKDGAYEKAVAAKQRLLGEDQ